MQVVENYSGRGLGKIACKETLRQIASMENDNVAMIFEWNAPSRAIFEKLGFQLQAGKIYRIFSMPTESIENSNWIGLVRVLENKIKNKTSRTKTLFAS